MPLLSETGFAADMADGADAIATTTGADPRPWFRLPFGAGHDDDRAASPPSPTSGTATCIGTSSSRIGKPWRTGDAIAADAIEGVHAHGDGAVVLLHTWPGGTADAVRPDRRRPP